MHPHSNGADVVSLGPYLILGEMCHLMRKVAQGVHGWRNGGGEGGHMLWQLQNRGL